MSDGWHPGEAFVRRVMDEMVPIMDGSAVYLSLLDANDDTGTVKFWVELGAAIMKDKPIIVVALGRVPKHLRKAADEIVWAPNGMNEEVGKDLQAAMTRIFKKYGLGELPNV